MLAITSDLLGLQFLRGMVATVNPCGFILLPTYLLYFLGVEAHNGVVDERASVRRALLVGSAVSAGFLLVFVFTLGSYLIASILGRPEHWTLSVFISDQASFNANVPFAAAMALFLTVLSLVVVGVVMLIETRTRSAD